jgi:HK97 family phage major capsid protein
MINQKLVVKSLGGENLSVLGYASVYNIADAHNDIIGKGAINFATNDVKFLWQHDYSKPIGVINSIIEDDYGLKIDATINNKISVGKETIELLKQKAINGLSVGIHVLETKYNANQERIITKAELIEVSVVTFPANNQAKIHHILNQEKHMELHNELETKAKIANLEEQVGHLQTVMARPGDLDFGNHEQKTAFNNYLRKGVVNDLVTKSFSGDAEEAGVLLVASLYEKIINQINAKSPMRRLASTQVISTNALDVILENGKFTTGWVAETAAREETATSKLVQKRIPVHELYAQPKATQKLLDDAAINLEQWLLERLSDSFIAAENDAFIRGDGENKPRGILSYGTQAITTVSLQSANIIDGLLGLINSLDEEYLAGATFLMNRLTLNEIQKLRDENGRFIWQHSLSDSLTQTIFGIPVVCCAEIPDMKSKKPAIILADFKEAYKIVDRKDINVMRDPYTQKPFVKFYAVKRVGGDVINTKAACFGVFAG